MQESGVPNVTGQVELTFYPRLAYGNPNSPNISLFTNGTGPFAGNNEPGANEGRRVLKFNSSYMSNQYQDNISEVRVKSIISNGYIRLY